MRRSNSDSKNLKLLLAPLVIGLLVALPGCGRNKQGAQPQGTQVQATQGLAGNAASGLFGTDPTSSASAAGSLVTPAPTNTPAPTTKVTPDPVTPPAPTVVVPDPVTPAPTLVAEVPSTGEAGDTPEQAPVLEDTVGTYGTYGTDFQRSTIPTMCRTYECHGGSQNQPSLNDDYYSLAAFFSPDADTTNSNTNNTATPAGSNLLLDSIMAPPADTQPNPPPSNITPDQRQDLLNYLRGLPAAES